MKVFTKAIAAGIMIGIGAIIYLSCSNKIAASLLFAIALFMICSFGMNLFTGKIGYVIEKRNDPNCLIIWLGNFLGCTLTALLARIAKPALSDAAKELMANKLSQNPLSIIILAFFCGILMYLAVENYASNHSDFGKVLGIFLCVSVFILSGFEHSIADIGYAAFAVSSASDAVKMLLFVIVVSVFNAVGSIMLHSLNTYNKS